MRGGRLIQNEDEGRQQRIKELRKKLEKFLPIETYVSPDCPPEVEEKFLQHILAFEDADPVSPFDELAKSGLQLPPPQELEDAELHSKLWDVIRAMTLLGCYLHNTDHLSDRELYERLWTDLLREPTTLILDNPDFACHIDIIGGCSQEDLQIYLKYYADEEARSQWAKDFPDDVVPPHEDPPYNRDRYLPEPSIYQSKLTG